MRYQSLDAWLDWQQTLNPKSMDLGLTRVKQVYNRLALDKIADRVIIVAGTNGKGSTVAFYETWLKNCGYRVASFTSPHLLHYNERIKLNLEAVSDDQLCQTFELIDKARDEIRLTYFEFGTLAALVLIAQFQPDFAILEVGLGGRLDAVNILDADLAHITTVGLDHQQWLGETREQIGFEKAGILREKCLAVCNDPDPPASVLSELRRLECSVLLFGQNYHFRASADNAIVWTCNDLEVSIRLPLKGMHQAQNISGVMAGLYSLGCLQGRNNTAIANAFKDVTCAGRLQQIDSSLPARLLLDVGHNQDAAQVLQQYLRSVKLKGKIIVLLGMLEDKDQVAFVKQLADVVDEWWLLDLNGYRGLSSRQLNERIGTIVRTGHLFDSAEKAIIHAMSSLDNQDILLVTGSFMTVESVLKTSIF